MMLWRLQELMLVVVILGDIPLFPRVLCDIALFWIKVDDDR